MIFTFCRCHHHRRRRHHQSIVIVVVACTGLSISFSSVPQAHGIVVACSQNAQCFSFVCSFDERILNTESVYICPRSMYASESFECCLSDVIVNNCKSIELNRTKVMLSNLKGIGSKKSISRPFSASPKKENGIETNSSSKADRRRVYKVLLHYGLHSNNFLLGRHS